MKLDKFFKFVLWVGCVGLVFTIIRLTAPTVNSWGGRSTSAAAVTLDRWSESIPGAAFMAITLVSAFWLILRDARNLREASERSLSDARHEVQAKPEKAKPAWDLARLTLESYFNRNLSQIAWIFWLSLAVMVAGFCVVVWGISQSIYLADQAANEGPATALKAFPAIISTAAGLITEFIGATFLFIYRSTIQQATNYSKTLERINSVGMAMQILDTMPENAVKSDLKSLTKAKLIELLVRGAHDQKSISAHTAEEPKTRSKKA